MDYKTLAKSLSAGRRPAGMSYREYTAIMRKSGKEPESEEEYEERDEEDDEGDDDEAEKSLRVEGDALRKSMRTYETVESGLPIAGGSRMGYLQARLENGTITKSERTELGALLMGDDERGSGTSMRKSMSERIDDDSAESGRLVRANDFLKSLVASIDDSLDAVHDGIVRENSQTRDLVKAQGEMVRQLGGFAVRLGEIVEDQSEMIKSLQERLGMVERQPVPPRARRTVNPSSVREPPLSKSVKGGGRSEGLSKGQILDGFRRLVVRAADVEKNEQLVKSLTEQGALYEQTGRIKKSTYEAIENELRGH